MSSAVCAVWRLPCSGLRNSSALPAITSRAACNDLRITPLNLYSHFSRRPLSSSNARVRTKSLLAGSKYSLLKLSMPTFTRSKRTTAPKPSPKRPGRLPGDRNLSDADIKFIFGPGVPTKLGNRTLGALQTQRLEGTLDLDLPADITRAVSQSQLDSALQWLRENYPLNEDAAILARIEREEIEAEEKLVRRAEELGLYKPQSGSYENELGEENSIYGKSVLKEAREMNEKRLLAEKERKRQEWLQGENEEQERLRRQFKGDTALQQYQEAALTEARPRADPNERPYLAWIQKHHIAATHESPEAMNLTTTQRLLAPALFTLLAVGLCYYFAQKYESPARKDRLWPSVPPAAATVGAIIGANVAITFMWKFIPPSWRLLNRYFVIVPLYPSAPSMLGSTFSHQTWRHLATNMMVLGLMGTRVHDELGRGNFLAIYFGSGAVGSLVSLYRSVLLGSLGLTSLGASAATSGIVAAWCMYHFDDKITMWILPHELRETLWTQGWIFLACLIGTEILSMATPARFLQVWPLSRLTKMDHAAHLGGYLAGAGCGYTLAQRRRRERERRVRDSRWLKNPST
ncbi:hypothetical protein N7532_009787 [Penicillium argentinense]|uniref:Peptidase S54 rhomboid domain-containing protein n=1 Tax=Penicillium argentinense TaxID=1131581 RepID=A0A9W9ENP0_9EURO|nr:uncharacterized protein N7532_009787 [Penicillium argentinense]KAJ5085016.1 hypothetical protein N7532_009787 [Penicillium argentinense]